MKLQRLLIAGIIVELCLLPMFEAKRSFGIARSRNKNKGPSVRRNNQGHDIDDHHSMPAPAHPKPSAPEMKKPVSYSSPPAGPPPAYPGMGHHSAAPHGAPPGYSPSYASPPGYSSGYNNHGSFGHQPHQNQFSPYGSGMPMGGGGMPMGGMSMGGGVPMGSPYMAGNYGRSSGFGSGIMTNLFAGLAGYQLAKAFSGGHGSRDREVIIIQNQSPIDSNPSQTTNAELTQKPSTDAQLKFNSPATENPEAMTNVGPANNEYNFYGIPQYGIPLYGYSLPSQITDYYQTAIVKTPQPFHPQANDQMPQPISEK